MAASSRRRKIEALLDSPIEGERQAAAEALLRVRSTRKPMPPRQIGFSLNPEYREWCGEESKRLNKMASFAYSRLSDNEARDRLSPAEWKVIRNYVRWRIDAPLREPFLGELEDIAAKLGWVDDA